MAGGKEDRWLFTKAQIENSPSRKCGVDAEKELSYRQQAANYIQDMGQRLQVTQLCINTAIVYMHRFYMFHSFTKFHRNEFAAACLFLAAKVEEQPRKLEHVVSVAYRCLHRELPPLDTKSEKYLEKAQELVFNENILLQTLGFDITVDHPHTHVVKTCQLVRGRLIRVSKPRNRYEEFFKETLGLLASKDLAQTSYFLATNSLHLTSMCLAAKPTVVACVAIHLACKWSSWEFPKSKEGKDWWFYVDRSVTLELLEEMTQDFLNIIEKCPNRLKGKIMTWKSEENSDKLHEQYPGAVAASCSRDYKSSSKVKEEKSDERKLKPETGPSKVLSPQKIKQEKTEAVQSASQPSAALGAPPTPEMNVGMRRTKSDASLVHTYKEYKEMKEKLAAAAAAASHNIGNGHAKVTLTSPPISRDGKVMQPSTPGSREGKVAPITPSREGKVAPSTTPTSRDGKAVTPGAREHKVTPTGVPGSREGTPKGKKETRHESQPKDEQIHLKGLEVKLERIDQEKFAHEFKGLRSEDKHDRLSMTIKQERIDRDKFSVRDRPDGKPESLGVSLKIERQDRVDDRPSKHAKLDSKQDKPERDKSLEREPLKMRIPVLECLTAERHEKHDRERERREKHERRKREEKEKEKDPLKMKISLSGRRAEIKQDPGMHRSSSSAEFSRTHSHKNESERRHQDKSSMRHSASSGDLLKLKIDKSKLPPPPPPGLSPPPPPPPPPPAEREMIGIRISKNDMKHKSSSGSSRKRPHSPSAGSHDSKHSRRDTFSPPKPQSSKSMNRSIKDALTFDGHPNGSGMENPLASPDQASLAEVHKDLAELSSFPGDRFGQHLVHSGHVHRNRRMSVPILPYNNPPIPGSPPPPPPPPPPTRHPPSKPPYPSRRR